MACGRVEIAARAVRRHGKAAAHKSLACRDGVVLELPLLPGRTPTWEPLSAEEGEEICEVLWRMHCPSLLWKGYLKCSYSPLPLECELYYLPPIECLAWDRATGLQLSVEIFIITLSFTEPRVKVYPVVYT